MRSIKKIMCSVILVMVTALIFDVFTRFLYVPCDSVNYFRQRDFKEQDGKIEVALCGTSIAKDGFNPSVFDKQLGMNSFNFGTSAQNVEHTYYLLQQLIKNNPLQVVYLNVSTETVAKRESSFDAKATIVDNYFHPLTKLKNFFNIYDMDEYERAMFYTYSLEDSSIAAVNTVRKNVLGKMKQELLLQRKPKSYAGKGHTAYQHIYDGTMPEKKYIKKKSFDEKKLDGRRVDYLNRLIRLCKENQIQLILVSFPGSGVLEKEIQNKEKMHEFFADIANEYDITYYALEEEKKGQLFLNDKFKDYLHLNKNGADLFSSMLCEQFWENEV